MAAANASVGAATGLASFAGRALELESEQRRTLSLLSASIPSAETLARISGFGSVAAASALKDSLAAGIWRWHGLPIFVHVGEGHGCVLGDGVDARG